MVRRRLLTVMAVIVIGVATGCLAPVPREEWPVRDDPLFPFAVWISAPDAYGSGVILHSSARGTYVLTAAHVVSDDDGYRFPDGEVEVGVYALSHSAPTGKPYALYAADIVATTSPDASIDPDGMAGLSTRIAWLGAEDLAILRLRTERRFAAAPLFTGSPDLVSYKAAVLIPVAPKMYPHREPASCGGDLVACPDAVDGNSGAPVFVGGRVVGICSVLQMGPGPGMLQAFIRRHEEIQFLLEEPGRTR